MYLVNVYYLIRKKPLWPWIEINIILFDNKIYLSIINA